MEDVLQVSVPAHAHPSWAKTLHGIRVALVFSAAFERGRVGTDHRWSLVLNVKFTLWACIASLQ